VGYQLEIQWLSYRPVLIDLEARLGFWPIVAPDPQPHGNWACGRSPDREQKQVHHVEGDTDVLKGPTNHESACQSKENVNCWTKSAVRTNLASDPSGQRGRKQPDEIEHAASTKQARDSNIA
jgi:hypothetical protein